MAQLPKKTERMLHKNKACCAGTSPSKEDGPQPSPPPPQQWGERLGSLDVRRRAQLPQHQVPQQEAEGKGAQQGSDRKVETATAHPQEQKIRHRVSRTLFKMLFSLPFNTFCGFWIVNGVYYQFLDDFGTFSKLTSNHQHRRLILP